MLCPFDPLSSVVRFSDQATESDDEFAQDFLEDGGDGDYDDGDDYGDDY